MNLITLLSDFGLIYPAVMKGVILKINPRANIVDITHTIPNQDIRAGAFILNYTAKYFPNNTVHIAVVDPEVGTSRRAIAIYATSANCKQYFVGPDNGLLIPAVRSFDEFKVYEITNKELLLSTISKTFHGRDIFAPVGAYLSKGIDIEKVGELIKDYVDLDFGKARIELQDEKEIICGEVVYIDDFGNIITNIPSDLVFKYFNFGDTIKIFDQKIPFVQTYGMVKEGELLATIGSHGFLEISVNRGSATRYLDISKGDLGVRCKE